MKKQFVLLTAITTSFLSYQSLALGTPTGGAHEAAKTIESAAPDKEAATAHQAGTEGGATAAKAPATAAVENSKSKNSANNIIKVSHKDLTSNTTIAALRSRKTVSTTTSCGCNVAIKAASNGVLVTPTPSTKAFLTKYLKERRIPISQSKNITEEVMTGNTATIAFSSNAADSIQVQSVSPDNTTIYIHGIAMNRGVEAALKFVLNKL